MVVRRFLGGHAWGEEHCEGAEAVLVLGDMAAGGALVLGGWVVGVALVAGGGAAGVEWGLGGRAAELLETELAGDSWEGRG